MRNSLRMKTRVCPHCFVDLNEDEKHPDVRFHFSGWSEARRRRLHTVRYRWEDVPRTKCHTDKNKFYRRRALEQALLIQHVVLMLGRSPTTSQSQFWNNTSEGGNGVVCAILRQRSESTTNPWIQITLREETEAGRFQSAFRNLYPSAQKESGADATQYWLYVRRINYSLSQPLLDRLPDISIMCEHIYKLIENQVTFKGHIAWRPASMEGIFSTQGGRDLFIMFCLTQGHPGGLFILTYTHIVD